MIRTTTVQSIAMCLVALSAFGQPKDLQRSITEVTNSQLVGNGKYVYQIVLASKSGDTIIAEASKIPLVEHRTAVTNMLLPLLTDSIRGIAVHFMLCAIWKRQTGF